MEMTEEVADQLRLEIAQQLAETQKDALLTATGIILNDVKVLKAEHEMLRELAVQVPEDNGDIVDILSLIEWQFETRRNLLDRLKNFKGTMVQEVVGHMISILEEV